MSGKYDLDRDMYIKELIDLLTPIMTRFERQLAEKDKIISITEEQAVIYLEDIEKKDAEITKLKGDIQCMVDKAARNHLPAYREMGEQLAAKDAEIERLRNKLKVILSEEDIRRFAREEAIRAHIEITLYQAGAEIERVRKKYGLQGSLQSPVASEATPEELDYSASYHPTD